LWKNSAEPEDFTMSELLVQKIQSVHRCVRYARTDYRKAGDSFAGDYTLQNSAILNLVRGCEQAIDIANHLIKTRKLGIPADSRESFILLQQAEIITPELSSALQKMVGFRNIAVHQYQEIDIALVATAIEKNSGDLIEFADVAAEFARKNPV